jgi:hypothetical protein
MTNPKRGSNVGGTQRLSLNALTRSQRLALSPDPLPQPPPSLPIPLPKPSPILQQAVVPLSLLPPSLLPDFPLSPVVLPPPPILDLPPPPILELPPPPVLGLPLDPPTPTIPGRSHSTLRPSLDDKDLQLASSIPIFKSPSRPGPTNKWVNTNKRQRDIPNYFVKDTLNSLKRQVERLHESILPPPRGTFKGVSNFKSVRIRQGSMRT